MIRYHGAIKRADDGIRTYDLRITNALLYQLSYVGLPGNAGANLGKVAFIYKGYFTSAAVNSMSAFSNLDIGQISFAFCAVSSNSESEIPGTSPFRSR